MNPQTITGIILAGGASTRMGGNDKGLALLHDRPLVTWVIERLTPQVNEIIVVANRNIEAYAAFGHPVVRDLRAGYLGPLAGLEAGLSAARRSWAVTCPVDAPLLPADYVARLCSAAHGKPAVVSLHGHMQPVCALLPRSSLPALRACLTSGSRKTSLWLESIGAVHVDFSADAAAFADADTREELQTLANRCGPPTAISE